MKIANLKGDFFNVKKFLMPVLIFVLAVSNYCFAEDLAVSSVNNNFVSGDVLVVLKPDNNSNVKISAADFNMGSEAFRLASVAGSHGAWVKETYPEISETSNLSFALLHSDSMTTEELINELSSRKDVLVASPNYKVQIAKTTDDPITVSANNGLWGLNYINIQDAWNYTTGDDEIYVAVLDTGIDHTNPDLTANVDTSFSYNVLNTNSNAVDDNGHGTHVAGIIGAVGNNGLGIVGTNWNVRMIPVKIFDYTGEGDVSNIILGLNYVAKLLRDNPNMKMAAVNMSLQIYYKTSPVYQNVIRDSLWWALKAIDSTNRPVIVVAAGNKNITVGEPSASGYVYPASYPGLHNMISVSAIDSNGNKADFSNSGGTISAPGVGILSTWLQSATNYHTDDGVSVYTQKGTSMAAPFVSGAAALLLAYSPTRTAYQLKLAILGENSISSSEANTASSGILNINTAIDYQNNNPNLPAKAATTQYDTIKIEDVDDNDDNIKSSSGSGGCNSGLSLACGIILASIIILRETYINFKRLVKNKFSC